MTSSKDMLDLISTLEDQGWTHDGYTGSGHHKVREPVENRMVVLPSTPSDWRAMKNAIALLRRYGADV